MLDKEIIIRRLAIIKYLYNIGVQQSMQVETVAGFSILTFHDCAEMFLLLVAENSNKKAESNFMNYWDAYPELTQKESIRALKDRRVSLKHKGQFPSKSDIEISRIAMLDFLEQNTKIQFQLNFNEISTSLLISYANVRDYIKQAETLYNKGDLYESLKNSKIAFMELLFAYESTKSMGYLNNGILNIGKQIGTDYRKLLDNDRDGKKWFEEVTDTTNKLRDILKITALGIDYKKYNFFNYVAPEVTYSWKNGERIYEYLPQEYYEERKILRGVDCKFCIDFVIDSALKLQEFDFDISEVTKVKR